MKRSTLALLGASLLLTSATLGTAVQAETDKTSQVQLLFVQNAEAMSYKDGTLTLEQIGPHTLYFSDRPQRLAGSMANQAFVEHWNKGKESFADDPPNAAITFAPEAKQQPAVIELIDVALEGDNLVYSMRILDGALPTSGGAVTLFIDNNDWGGNTLGSNVDPATDPELGFGTTFGDNWGPAFANASEPEDLRGQGPGGAGLPANSSCGSHSMLRINICF